MQKRHVFVVILTTLFYSACTGHHKQKIYLTGVTDSNHVVYVKNKAEFFIGQTTIYEYCKNKDTLEHNNFIYKQLLDYLNEYKSKSITIPDTLGTRLIPYNEVYLTSPRNDTLIRVRDETSKYADVKEAMDWLLLDILKNGNIKVFDKKTAKFVDYVTFDSIETKTAGESEILLPNSSTIFSKLRWIK